VTRAWCRSCAGRRVGCPGCQKKTTSFGRWCRDLAFAAGARWPCTCPRAQPSKFESDGTISSTQTSLAPRGLTRCVPWQRTARAFSGLAATRLRRRLGSRLCDSKPFLCIDAADARTKQMRRPPSEMRTRSLATNGPRSPSSCQDAQTTPLKTTGELGTAVHGYGNVTCKERN
jgi:hypothetical protein